MRNWTCALMFLGRVNNAFLFRFYSAQSEHLFLFGLMSIPYVFLLFLFLCLFCIFISGAFRGIGTLNISKWTFIGSTSTGVYVLFICMPTLFLSKCLLGTIFRPLTKYIIFWRQFQLLNISSLSYTFGILYLFSVFCTVCSTYSLLDINW